MRRRTVAVAAAALWLVAAPPVIAQEPRLVIVSPSATDYVSDRVAIDVHVAPPEVATAVTEYVYFVDGKEACRAPGAAPACVWDAGAVVRAHQVRVVATLATGSRLVASVRTKAIDIAESAAVRRVQVPVVVTSRDGGFVPGLKAEAFSLSEDGRPQAIAHFSDENAPLVVELAFDLSESMRVALPDLKAAVAGFARRLPATSRVTLLAFNEDIFTLGQPGDSLERRLELLTTLECFDNTALYDAIVRGLDDLSRASGRRALVVFTDGDDSASRATHAQVRSAVEGSDASVYFVALGRGREVETLVKGMDDLAALSGGRTLQAEKASELDRRFSDVLTELAHQYLIGYEPSNAALDGRWRKIDVRLKDGGGRRVRARVGYRAPTAP